MYVSAVLVNHVLMFRNATCEILSSIDDAHLIIFFFGLTISEMFLSYVDNHLICIYIRRADECFNQVGVM